MMMIDRSSRGSVRIGPSKLKVKPIKGLLLNKVWDLDPCSSEKANTSSEKINKMTSKAEKTEASACGQMKKRILVSPPPSQPPSKRFKGVSSGHDIEETKRVGLGDPSSSISASSINHCGCNNKALIETRFGVLDPVKQALIKYKKTTHYQEFMSKISQQQKQKQAQISLQQHKENADKLEHEKPKRQERERERQEARLALDSMKPTLDLEPSWCTILSQLQTLPGFVAASWGGGLLNYTPYYRHH